MTSTFNTVLEAKKLASKVLPQTARDYINGGSGDEQALVRNRRGWKDINLIPRVLVDVSNRNPSTNILGIKTPFPCVIAPTAYHKLAHPEAEFATASAASEAGVIMTVSTFSNTPIEKLTSISGNQTWFQLYVYRDRGITKELIKRVEASGCKAFVVTVDVPILGKRVRDIRNGFCLPADYFPANLTADSAARLSMKFAGSSLEAFVKEQLDDSLCWKDLEWIRSQTSLPIIVKGILHPDDAVRACQLEVDGIVVSNHGGRQLSVCPSTAEMLPLIRDSMPSTGPLLLVDGGVRSGTEIFKALALGADAVLVGRPILWGLAHSGKEGVSNVLNILRCEFTDTMALCGVSSVEEINRVFIRNREF